MFSQGRDTVNETKSKTETKTETHPPAVGDGATYSIGLDCYAYTVIEVSPSGKTIRVQRDRVVRVGGEGEGENSRYIYIPNTDQEVEVFTLRKSGNYYRKGSPAIYGAITVGRRDHSRDMGR